MHYSRFYRATGFTVNQRRRAIGAPGPSLVQQYLDKLIAKGIKKRRKNFRPGDPQSTFDIRENYMSKLAIVGAFLLGICVGPLTAQDKVIIGGSGAMGDSVEALAKPINRSIPPTRWVSYRNPWARPEESPA